MTIIERGGAIPGTAGKAAFTLCGPEPTAIPVLIAVPHAGRIYPGPLLDRLRDPGQCLHRLEDRHADSLAQAVALASGARIVLAHAPRAMIDLNRAPDDIDWEMIAGRSPGCGHASNGRRARTGLGLIPRRLPGFGELWKGSHDLAELEQRIADVHEPYHACIGRNLEGLRQRWGAALLLDFHSMPPLARKGAGPTAQIVVSDRFGASCHGRFIASAFSHFAGSGLLAAHNRPYSGGYGIKRHAAPARGIHAIQIEIDRSRYLDARLDEPGQGLDSMAAILAGLVRALALEVTALPDQTSAWAWPEAAE